jgi:hypothetical protein
MFLFMFSIFVSNFVVCRHCVAHSFFNGCTVPLLGPGRYFSIVIQYTVGSTPWTGDQPVARPQPTHRTAQTQNKRTHTYIHASSGNGTHDPSVRAGENSSCLRPPWSASYVTVNQNLSPPPAKLSSEQYPCNKERFCRNILILMCILTCIECRG